jgi:hypothetical protein
MNNLISYQNLISIDNTTYLNNSRHLQSTDKASYTLALMNVIFRSSKLVSGLAESCSSTLARGTLAMLPHPMTLVRGCLRAAMTSTPSAVKNVLMNHDWE